MTSSGSGGPLAGLTIIDLTRFLAGPIVTMVLGDLGADVIKVEESSVGDYTRTNIPMKSGESHYFLSINRNKRSVTIDLKSEPGRQVLLDLAAKGDVLVENFRPGVMDRLGLSYDRIKVANPRLVYCSISGFGQDGPLRDKTAFDIVTQAMSGVMSINGDPAGPPTKLGLPMGDIGGGLMAVIAILSALRERQTTGEGQRIDISLHDSLTYLLGYFSGMYFMTGESAERFGSAHHNIVPYGAFPASDGYVVIAAFTQGFWLKLCRALKAPALADDPRFRVYADRYANRDACDQAVAALTSQYTVHELAALLENGDVPSAPVLGIAEALEHPQLGARDMILEVQHPTLGLLKVLGSPFKMSNWPGRPAFGSPPLLGEDTESVLREYLGYTSEAIARVQGVQPNVDAGSAP